MSRVLCCVGRQGLARELMSLGHHTAGLTAGVSFSNQRAVGAKGLWGVNHVSTLYLLHFASGVYFKRLSGSCLCLASRIPHYPAAPERVAVLELVCHQPCGKCSCQFKTCLPDHLRMLCGAG